MRIKPNQVTKNAGKIQNLLAKFGMEMAKTSAGYNMTGEGYHSNEEIATSIMHAEKLAADRLGISAEEEYYGQQPVDNFQYRFQQPSIGVMNPYPYNTPSHQNANFGPMHPPINYPATTNFTTEEDMETIDISKYIGKPKQEQPKPVQGDMGMLLKEMKETNKRLEAMCKILGLIYQQNIDNNTIRPADFGFSEAELKPHQMEDEMTPAEETEMLNNLAEIPVIDPMAEDTEQ